MAKRKLIGKVKRPKDSLCFVDKGGRVYAVPMKRRRK